MDLKNSHIMTAMVTPFGKDGNVDYELLKKLIDHLLSTGTDGILVSGTTGEGPTLTEEEKIELIEKTVEYVAGRVPVVAGTGSNNTKATIEYTNKVAKIDGVDAALVVVPYYNKPDQAGMIAHFTAVADNVNLPIVMYNIPGRTGVTMEVKTIAELSKHQNIIGIKDCTGIVNMAEIVANTPDDFLAFTGEDADALAARNVGAQGVISVASHLFGKEISQMYAANSKGDNEIAGELMRDLTPKMKALFSHPSPSPVKAALNHVGIEVGGCRLPILALDDAQASVLFNQLGI
ncbi:4-hydroxy-tetrahydrodipicolinate synthase [Ligilactobacillus ruminis]|uniref:4-hydroxy-tetrahydrodipicolinate synthase n=2 Tax=Ligilactobacillus ruminis TaxID=1623 RepID=E7FR17_9LACO|nr:4-hydroxy-tetrahydrodipicolinate synthase [Ligilactobacillus ruminis]EFZ34404.1 dihydrodipicolinate synthase [Ligilactobacillus ruminis ATCC 25644]EGX97633.1 dihydrodipicolinate synthase [Ligilactobacillus ruminis ATCC 25644]UWP39502.1 4-hydroxy-tetrahydrodipicolinate synthase [Ligilactobacillus ruminis]HCI90349.1 4-hydroxy-tetrahydrodipicolinate synthase [Lactobacillus sp.]